ncbi:CLUMA_CG020562, isoform A [Clunio marinus]|uniref:CLUMA_CG020562, isoform A n=1 Tax=Clunio marinus TaxID=568069 RepID=A0A1J1J5B1_9DIPT|nr:CLUMA_CG020562, isoform A [Clunio marinus]
MHLKRKFTQDDIKLMRKNNHMYQKSSELSATNNTGTVYNIFFFGNLHFNSEKTTTDFIFCKSIS